MKCVLILLAAAVVVVFVYTILHRLVATAWCESLTVDPQSGLDR